MAVEIIRFMKQHDVPYKEALYFAYPEELGIPEDDPRLIEIPDVKGKVFWFRGHGHRSADPDFYNTDIPIEQKQWNPYKHKLEEGVTESSSEEYDQYVKKLKQQEQERAVQLEKEKNERQKKRAELIKKLGITEEEFQLLIS